MDERTFKKFCEIVYKKSGITLRPGKEALVSARIGKRMRSLEMASHREYLDFLLKDTDGDELINLLDAISTNVTSFFREPRHFDLVKEIVQREHQKGQSSFRFWSAASSSGEEPYSLAISLKEAIDNPSIDYKILATDISMKILNQAVEGKYREDKFKNVPNAIVSRYFSPCDDEKGRHHLVSEKIKKMVLFKRMNLSKPPFPMKGPFDLVFCRNVMIYFDNRVRSMLLNEICRLLKPGGYLFVGHAESLTGMMVSGLKNVEPSVYLKE